MALMTVVYGPDGDPITMIEIRRQESASDDDQAMVAYDVWEHVDIGRNKWKRKEAPVGIVYHRRIDGWAKLVYKGVGLLVAAEPPYNERGGSNGQSETPST